jgi:hypothetical protein
MKHLSVLALSVFSFVSAASAASDVPLVEIGPADTADAIIATVEASPGSYLLESSPNLLLWSDLATVDIGASCEAQVRCELTEGESLFLRAIRQEAWDCVSIGTQGAAFSPRIECSGSESPVIRWAFDGGTTSSAYPEATIDYGTAAARTHVLTVRPPARLTELNLGYDGGDGGTAPVDYIAPQDVTSISFPHPIETLRVFCASNNTALTSLDLSAQSGLEIVECYCTSNLRNVKVAGLANVRRLCFEDCDLDALDISGCPALEDLRGAVNSYTRIDVGGGTGPNIWHWCTRDNPQLQQEFCDFMGSFTSMRELYIWNDNQHGVFKIGSHVLTELLAAQNHYTSVVLGTSRPACLRFQLQRAYIFLYRRMPRPSGAEPRPQRPADRTDRRHPRAARCRMPRADPR